MAIVLENNYIGDGSTVLYSFTFEYIDTTDVEVSLDNVKITTWKLANATTVEFTTPPAAGAKIKIRRRTELENVKARFYPGSAIRAQDLNENFEQLLFVGQEAEDVSATAEASAKAAEQSAANAESSAAAAQASAANAVTVSNGAVATANSAVATANAADAKSDQAISDSINAVTVANNTADLVKDALQFLVVPNVAAIPASPADRDAVEVKDSTGIQSFSPLSGRPAGFVGDAGLAVQIIYDAAKASWVWVKYLANDPEVRYKVWDRTGTELSPKTAGDSVFTSGAVKVGGTTAAPKITLKADGGIVSNGLVYDAATNRIGLGNNAPKTSLEASSANVSGDDNLGNVFIRTTDAQGSNIGGKITLGGFYNATANYPFAGIAGRKENGTLGNVAGYLQLLTTTSAGALTEKARIDSSGRLLVGLSIASEVGSILPSDVQVERTGSADLSLFCNANHTGGSYLRLGKSRGTTIGSNTIVKDSDELGGVYFAGADGVDRKKVGGSIITFVDGTPAANSIPGRLVFSTTASGSASPTERMRITQDGQTLVGGTSPAGNSNNVVQLGKYGGSAIAIGASNTSGNSTMAEFFRGTTKVGEIYTTGTSSTTYSTSSDYRLKENAVALQNAAERLSKLKPCRFNFISDPGIVLDGFLAHEAQAVVPEAVKGVKDEVDDDGNPVYQGIDQSKLVPLLTAALQEALQKIEDLETRLTDAGL